MGTNKSLATLVAEECAVNVGRFNLIHDAEKRAKKMAHHNACKALQAFATESGFPITVLVYIGVGTNAHRPCVFEQGYAEFKESRTRKIVNMAKTFANHMGQPNLAHNANLIHALCRYEAQGNKSKDFATIVKGLDKATFSMRNYKNAKEVANYLFGGVLEFNEHGYICPTKG